MHGMSSEWSSMVRFLSAKGFIVGKGSSFSLNLAIQLSEEDSRSFNGDRRLVQKPVPGKLCIFRAAPNPNNSQVDSLLQDSLSPCQYSNVVSL